MNLFLILIHLCQRRCINIPEIELKKKVIIVGANAVGKTSLLNSFIHRRFDVDYKATLGVNISAKAYPLTDEITVTFSFWDLGGQKLFRNIYPRFFAKSDAAMIVFDVTRMDSFDDLMNWHATITNFLKATIPILLVGNKIDLINERVVPNAMAIDLAKEQEFLYVETSAKTGANVNEAFRKMAETLAESYLHSNKTF